MKRLVTLLCLTPYFWSIVLLFTLSSALLGQEGLQISKVDSLISTANGLIEEDNTRSKNLLDEAMELCDAIGYWEGKALVLKNYGVLQDISGNSNGAQDFYDRALVLYTKHNVIDDRFTDILLNKGVAYYLAGQNDLALKQYLLAYTGYTLSGNQKRISYVLNNLGIIYRIKKNYIKARAAYLESYNLKLSIGDSIGGAKNLNNIALLYGHENVIDSSIHYFAASKRLFQLNGYDGNAQLVDLDLGHTYFIVNDYSKAIELLSKVLSSDIIEYASAKQRTSGILALSQSYREMGDITKAHQLLLDNKDFLEEHGTQTDLVDTYLVFSKTHADRKEYELAYNYLEKHRSIQAGLIADNRIKYEEEMTAQFNLLDKENELQSQELILVSQRKIRDRLIAGVALVSILSVLLYILLRTKNRLNANLENKNVLVNKALDDKNVLMKEIHHRVKNNLQIISSLLNLQRRHQNNEKTSAAFLDGQNRVKSMSMIHQLLYQENQLTSINTRVYVDKLVGSLSAAYKIDPNLITFINEVEELNLDVDTMIPLGLVLNELITNAYKYAFDSNQKGKLGIKLVEVDKALEVRVYDDGIGFPEDFDIKNTSSFGYKLIHSLGRKLEASISLQHDDYNTVIVMIHNYKITA